MTSDSAHVRRPVTPPAKSVIDVGHGEPHQSRQAAVAAGVPANVKTMVRAAARIMALSVKRKPLTALHRTQAWVATRTSTTISATTIAAPASIHTIPTAVIRIMFPPRPSSRSCPSCRLRNTPSFRACRVRLGIEPPGCIERRDRRSSVHHTAACDGHSRLSFRGWRTLVFAHPFPTPGRRTAVPCVP